MHNKCNALELYRNLPPYPLILVSGKTVPIKLVPGAKKGWGLLL